MAMTIPVNTAPTSPSSPHSDAGSGSQTPISPSAPPQTLSLPPPVDQAPNNGAHQSSTPTNGPQSVNGAKRKPSRRANTAERRATHNAVERQRRETLNGRFLDLAALLPNLSQIRRPSKSSIVNSSIAYINSSRRHRLLAARELRLLKLESDALRRELNEWRNRSGLPLVEEPVRGEAFAMVMSGEVEVIGAGLIEEDEGEYGADDYGNGGDEDFGVHQAFGGMGTPTDVTPFAHNVSHHANHGHPGLHLQTILPRPSTHGAPSPMIVQSPTNVSFENPAMAASGVYDSHAHSQQQQGFFHPLSGQQGQQRVAEDKWNNMYAQSNAQQFTPPTSSHGLIGHPHSHSRHVYGSPVDGDDASSVGSNSAAIPMRERSGSMNSHGGSPVHGGSPSSSVAGSYEVPSVLSGHGMPQMRRMGSGWDDGMGMGGMGNVPTMGGLNGMGGMGPMQMKQMNVNGMASGVVGGMGGGGGNGHGHGFAAAMMM